MQVEQFIMAYEAEQDRLRALLPEGFVSGTEIRGMWSLIHRWNGTG